MFLCKKHETESARMRCLRLAIGSFSVVCRYLAGQPHQRNSSIPLKKTNNDTGIIFILIKINIGAYKNEFPLVSFELRASDVNF